jgi:hypothetical protein
MARQEKFKAAVEELQSQGCRTLINFAAAWHKLQKEKPELFDFELGLARARQSYLFDIAWGKRLGGFSRALIRIYGSLLFLIFRSSSAAKDEVRLSGEERAPGSRS